jgi:hypothetical protein
MSKPNVFTLIKEGYEPLECPICEKLCPPSRKYPNGTIQYSRHKCKASYELLPKLRSFSILANGDLKSMS